MKSTDLLVSTAETLRPDHSSHYCLDITRATNTSISGTQLEISHHYLRVTVHDNVCAVKCTNQLREHPAGNKLAEI